VSLDLVASEGGCRLRLRVRAGASRDALDGEHDGALRVRVTVPPERGKANRRVLELLAQALGVAPTSLRLLSGESRAVKTVWVPLEPKKVRGLLPAAPKKSG
jgi:uncharacterized protein YggU (UPF0235/DUF167 family)